MGDAHERRVAEELALRGWDVSPWGQGVLTEAVRVALRGTESSLRWTPDLVAAKDRQVFLIDCKSRMTSRITHRHAVERAAAWTQLPICYVFDNLDILTPLDVLMLGRTGPQPAAGSGSPYHLVPTRRSLAFDEVFGTMQQRHTPQLGAA